MPDQQRRDAALSRTEWRIAECIAKGMPHKDIAAQVCLSIGTVTFYLSTRIYPTLGVTNAVQLARYWITHVEERSDCSGCQLFQRQAEKCACEGAEAA